MRQFNEAAQRIAGQGANDNLASNVVDLKTAQHAVHANLALMRAADETVGSLIDLLA
jgi:hypothetical protein